MEFTVSEDEGFAVAAPSGDTGLESTFEEVAKVLTAVLGIKFITMAGGLDSLYWEFSYKGASLFLHYDIWVGTEIIPKQMKAASKADNESVKELAREIRHLTTSGRAPE